MFSNNSQIKMNKVCYIVYFNTTRLEHNMLRLIYYMCIIYYGLAGSALVLISHVFITKMYCLVYCVPSSQNFIPVHTITKGLEPRDNIIEIITEIFFGRAVSSFWLHQNHGSHVIVIERFLWAMCLMCY